MSRNLDLDAMRAARAEQQGDAPMVTFAGVTFTLPPELPFAVVDAFVTDDAASFRRGAVALLGEEGLARMIDLGATRDDVRDLMVRASNELYEAVDSPEVSSAS